MISSFRTLSIIERLNAKKQFLADASLAITNAIINQEILSYMSWIKKKQTYVLFATEKINYPLLLCKQNHYNFSQNFVDSQLELVACSSLLAQLFTLLARQLLKSNKGCGIQAQRLKGSRSHFIKWCARNGFIKNPVNSGRCLSCPPIFFIFVIFHYSNITVP